MDDAHSHKYTAKLVLARLINTCLKCFYYHFYGVGLVKEALLLSKVLVSTICGVEKAFFIHDQITKNSMEDRYMACHFMHFMGFTCSLRKTL